MRISLFRSLLGVLAVSLVATACAPKEDWNDPEWIGHRMQVGDEQAFLEFAHLSPEEMATLTPTLIQVYADGLRPEQCMRALLQIGSPDARGTYENALGRSDDHLAALGARGLAGIQATDAASDVATRLMQVTTPEEFAPFMDALLEMPTPESAEVVSDIVQRRAVVSAGSTQSGAAASSSRSPAHRGDHRRDGLQPRQLRATALPGRDQRV